MKKQYKLYYNTTFIQNPATPIKSEGGMLIWECDLHGFRVHRVDVCTCDNIYTARVLRDIIHDNLKQEVQIEEVEVVDYE